MTDNAEDETLDLLIEQEQKLLAAFDARQASADARAAAALTAAFALLTVSAAVAREGTQDTHWSVYLALAAIFVLVAVALIGRIVPGLRVTTGEELGEAREPLFSTESTQSRESRRSLWDKAWDDKNPTEVRGLALELWRARAQDSRSAAIAREKWAAGATGALVVAALVSVAVIVFSA